MGTTSFATGDPLVFQPFPLLRNAHLQTMLGHWLRVPARVPSRTEIVDLSDGDRLALEISEPIGDAAPARTVVLIHGLAGCHESAYLVRVAAKLVRRGMRAVRLNLRGCGSGAGLARGIFHSGQSDDLRQTIEALRARGQGSRVSVIGFSLGGNIALKLAGELGERGPELVDRVLAVCPPADLERCANLISRPENRLYDAWFVRHLRRFAAARHRAFPELGPLSLPKRMTLVEFDELYTALHGGFKNARDYYQRSSAAPLVPRIRVPAHVLFAKDDPFIDPSALDRVERPDHVEVVTTHHGGHMGFLARPGAEGGIRWLDRWILSRLG